MAMKICKIEGCCQKVRAKQLCYNHWQQESRKQTKNKSIKTYEKTINGFLMRVYRNMLSRVNGIQKEKLHIYKGLEILDKEMFYQWSKTDHIFNTLFKNWELSNYNQKLTPSIDRINSDKGYTIDNIRWLTNSENSKFGAMNKWSNE